jgi:hypothetical protein
MVERCKDDEHWGGKGAGSGGEGGKGTTGRCGKKGGAPQVSGKNIEERVRIDENSKSRERAEDTGDVHENKLRTHDETQLARH